jgi:3-hydroxyacyl-CoA dehydrogenase
VSDLVQLSQRDGVAVITINNPPVNALSPGVPDGIGKAIEQVEKDESVKAAVLIGAGRTFVAGADIREFARIAAGKDICLESINPVLTRVENCTKPIVAAVHGTAFGGGLELAMACHYRVAARESQVGQPEVKLGLIPGAGGTQRLPRLAGVAKAVEMCAEGNPISADEAFKFGIIDRVVEGDLLERTLAFVKEIVDKPGPKTRECNEKLGANEQNAAIFAAARENARKKQRNLQAPQAAIDAVEAATMMPFEQGSAKERDLFEKCLHSDQSKALIHVFFGEREVAKIPDIPKETPILPVNSLGVVGAGTMGGGIAMVFANAGIPVLLKESEQAALERGISNIQKTYANSVKRGRFTQQFVDERLKLIRPSLNFSGFGEVDMVVEAVFENMALKKEVFAQLDAVCKPGAILASNTSTLNIDEVASATSRPESVIGTHFFSPANVMRLLEIVRGEATSKEVIATCMQLSKKIGKVGVLVGNCVGFVGNRMFGPYRREAQFLVEEGASIEAVDKALYDFGMAMGPLATGDLAGLDVGWRIRKEHKHLQKPGMRQPLIEDRLCEMGRFGQKTGGGWYKYDENRKPSPDPEVAALIHQWSSDAGVPQRQISPEEIVERCIYTMVNEGARILEEGYALRAVDIDVIYLNGYGFPAYRGGPMWYADTVGLRKVYDRVREFEQRFGSWWESAPLLKRLAEQGKSFREFSVERSVAA